MTPTGPSPYHAIPIPPQVHYDQDSAMQQADRRARKRFFQALIAGFAIWFWVGLISSGIVGSEEAARRHRGNTGWSVVRTPIDHKIKCNGFQSLPSPAQAQPQQTSWISSTTSFHPISVLAAQFSPYSLRTSTTKFKIPLAEVDSLFLHGTGSWSHGNVEFLVDEELRGDAEVVVVAKYNNDALLEDSDVCLVRESIGSGAHRAGVEIIVRLLMYLRLFETSTNLAPYQTPSQIGPNNHYDQLTFSITYRLPSTLSSLTSLNISASIFATTSSSLPFLSSLHIITSNAPITLDTIRASTIFLQTTNAPIRVGTASATESIYIKDTNGRVEGKWETPEMEVVTSNAIISGRFTIGKRLEMTTSNLGIDAKIALVNGTRFEVGAKTSNGRVRVEYTEQPKGSRLSSTVETSNLGAVVLMDPQYEGSFYASTTNLGVTVTGPYTKVDPSDSNRSRHIELRAISKTVEGSVWWSEEKGKGDGDREERGSTSVKSTNSRVELQFL
ncbi:hypothetical protein P7C70_g2290, partial [Phenoliferia sp. Uapishka_3]